MIHNISITEEALEKVAKEVCCTLSTLKRLLGLAKYTFKPFDKVLVRDNLDDPWTPRFFEAYCEVNPLHYTTIGGTHWYYCIPYEGNEDKLK